MIAKIGAELLSQIPLAVSVASEVGGYRVTFQASERQATAPEILAATKAVKLDAINAECKARLVARFGSAEEQVSRSMGVYGQSEQTNMLNGIGSTIDASNVARNSVIGAADIAAVGAVTVAWPVI
jgi:hypothetical protein